MLFNSSTYSIDVVSYNIMINGYVKIGDIEDARKVFDEMPTRDEVSWSSMIGGYATSGQLDIARYLFERMPEGKNVVTWNSMVGGFARNGMVGLARRYFDEMPERNLVSWNAMVTGYAMNGEMGLARELFEVMEERDVVSWSCMIKGYAMCGKHLDALKLFKEMMKEGKVRPNEITMVSVLSACANLSALDHGEWIHDYIDRNGMALDDDYNLGAALIDMYFKCAAMESALDVFHSLNRKNVSSWNSLITGLGINGLASDALCAFEKMQRSGIKPNDITFLAVLNACTHGGLVEEGRRYLKKMYEVYGVQPEIKHYGCMIDLLGRAGLLEEAEEMVKRMPMKPDVMVLGALLGACQIHGNVEVAERVKNEFLELNSQQAGCHVLLCNIYATADRWADASRMRENLKEMGIKKKAGSSSVEFDGEYR